MVSSNISRIRRRKLEREATLKDFQALASELNLTLIRVRGLRPEIMYDAVDLLCEARALLPDDADAIVQSVSPETGLYIAVTNCVESQHSDGTTVH